MSNVTVQLAGCHPECLSVSTDSHQCNINMVGMTNPQQWRVDCDTCFTCVRASFLSKEEAVKGAISHVQKSSEEYWASKEAGNEWNEY